MSDPVTVRLLDRDYTVGCSAEERDDLLAAARLLDARLREMRGAARLEPLERIAVLTALNLAHELQQTQRRGENAETAANEIDRGLAEMNRRVELVLAGAEPRILD